LNHRNTFAFPNKGGLVQKEYVADLVAYDKIVVEIKALDRLSGTEQSQILNYLKVTRFKVGVLINFGADGKLEGERFIK